MPKKTENNEGNKEVSKEIAEGKKITAKKAVAGERTQNETVRAASNAKSSGAKDIGVPVKNPPKNTCSDSNCPYHGRLSIRGRIFKGAVTSDKMDRGVIVEWEYLRELPKYKRFMRKKSSVPAHNPSCINAHKGNTVRIAECRPLSKTKSFVVIEVLK